MTKLKRVLKLRVVNNRALITSEYCIGLSSNLRLSVLPDCGSGSDLSNLLLALSLPRPHRC